MVHMLLASQFTIYVGGLVVFVPTKDNKEIDLVFLKGNVLMHGHNVKVGDHEAWLVARADDLCLEASKACPAVSEGFRLVGGAGEDQLARFRIEDEEIDLRGDDDPNQTITLKNAMLAPIGMLDAEPSSCKQEVKAYRDLVDDWPVDAWLRLENATIEPAPGHVGRLMFHPPCEVFDTTVADRVKVTVKLKKSDQAGEERATLKWGKGGSLRSVIFKPGNATLALWNLPEEREHYLAGSHHAGSPHFEAYYSVLEKQKDCKCRIKQMVRVVNDVTTSEPIFCPPAQASLAP